MYIYIIHIHYMYIHICVCKTFYMAHTKHRSAGCRTLEDIQTPTF